MIVVGVDSSPGAVAALRWALEEAELRQSSVRVVYAWQRPITNAWHGIPAELLTSRALDRAARAVLARAVELSSDGRPQVETVTVEGPAAEVLIAASRAAELLVVGGRREHTVGRILSGSVSGPCLLHAYCPVVVVHAQADAPAPHEDSGHRALSLAP